MFVVIIIYCLEYSNGRKEEQEPEPATVERLGPVGEAGGGAKLEEAGARLPEVGSCLPEDPPGYFTFLDPGKRVRVSEEEIKQIQKRAVIDYYRRYLSSFFFTFSTA